MNPDEVPWDLGNNSKITELPESLKVNREIKGFKGPKGSVPEHLKGKLK